MKNIIVYSSVLLKERDDKYFKSVHCIDIVNKTQSKRHQAVDDKCVISSTTIVLEMGDIFYDDFIAVR